MVLIVQTDAIVPVFHQFGRPTEAQAEHGQHVGVCGATTCPYGQARIRLEHALKFARPCQRCFPGGFQ